MTAANEPQVPAWLNLDALMPPAERADIRELIEKGEALAEQVASWSRWARSALQQPVDSIVWEIREIQDVLGFTSLADLMHLLGEIGGHPAGTPDGQMIKALLAKYPEYGDLLPEVTS